VIVDAEKTRTIETSVEIAAPAAEVWRALTEAEALTNWWPLEARVKPGAGGTMWMSWGAPYEFETAIEVWEAPRRLRSVYQAGGAEPVGVEYVLEGRGGATTLRLVHTGFSSDPSWDGMYDGTRRGWRACLGDLKRWLERHRGQRRSIVLLRRVTPGRTRAETWREVFSARGLLARGSIEGLAAGDALDVATVWGERLAGTVVLHEAPVEFVAELRSHGGSVLRIHQDDFGGSRDVWLSLSAWGERAPDLSATRRGAEGMLDALFGGPTEAAPAR
jgi:uncharacterized protein YndB with AHSA1/START domain